MLREDNFSKVSTQSARSTVAAGHEAGQVYPLRDKWCLDYIFRTSHETAFVEAILHFGSKLKIFLVEGTLANGLYLIPDGSPVSYYYGGFVEDEEALVRKFGLVISYSVLDYELTQDLKKACEALGLTVFLYELGSDTANPFWFVAYKQAMSNGSIFVPVITQNLLAGDGARLEYAEARATAHTDRGLCGYFPIVPFFSDSELRKKPAFENVLSVPVTLDGSIDEFARFTLAVKSSRVLEYAQESGCLGQVDTQGGKVFFPEFGAAAIHRSTGQVLFVEPEVLERPFSVTNTGFN